MTELSRRQRGFTLVEAIVVIVITGIVASFVAVFIRLPVQSHVDTAARIALADTADTALGRINRELRLALPNSVVVANGNTALQFVLTKAGGRYVDVNNLPPAGVLPLRFDGASTQFDIVGPAPTGRAAIVPDDLLVINNTGAAPANVYALNRNNVVSITAIAGNRVTLAGGLPLAAAAPPPYRFRIAAGTVTYLCNNNRLVRHFTRTIPKSGVADINALGPEALLADRATCAFRNLPLPTQAGTSLVTASLQLTSTGGETVSLVRQTQVENLP
ncbi:prepilin-type N-terminal cleavage/methylation domain-containing protein [Pseudoduganella buxea]|nr:prepilin-type N-terminal cleavage/methylation domain-containing protein [Pseudoduganella buxea]MTV54388.1 prepilin-type N-terminal cleavage/methylation domain-containing protein [Pseudoduganella buxea]